MGAYSDKKTNIGHLFGSLIFSCESIYEISNKHAQFKIYAMHQKVCNVKMPKMTMGHNSRITFQNLFKS